MKMIKDQITLAELRTLARNSFGQLVKAVVDVERGIMAIDGELHSDEEALLLKNGSKQKDLWGINIYPENDGPDRIEFDSLINLRPSANNLTRGITDPQIREKIIKITDRFIKQ